MTIALVMPRPARMPGCNNAVDLDEVSGLSSDYSFPQSSMVSHTSGPFSFSQTEPATDLLNGSSWGALGEGSQNFHDFPDSGSSHSGEAEEYIFTASGQTTPRGSRLDRSRAPDSAWAPPRSAQSAAARAQAMSRANSSRSNGSSLSLTSHMSHMDVGGNVSPTSRNGSQASGALSGLDSCLLLDSDANASASPLYWANLPLEVGLNVDTTSFPMDEVTALQHVVPAQMHLGSGSQGPDNASPTSWDQFSASLSRTPSPATDESWLVAHLSPDTSPEMQCQSPSADGTVTVIPDDLSMPPIPQTEERLTMAPAYSTRRSNADGESGARDHHLYKTATPHADGRYHCPWEGEQSCNHKPEKLKCNYDKFVDSHLKPYRCKAESCENTRFSSTACLLRHEREAHGLHGHGEKPYLCLYQGCERAVPGNGFPRQWNLRDHMKRVHNDHSSAGGSPPSGTAPHSGKGRKRKTEVPPQASGSRKASLKSMPLPDSKQGSTKPLLEEWLDHRKAVESILRGLDQPAEPRALQQITEVQRRLDAMAKMTSNMASKTDLMTAIGRTSYVSTG